MGRVDKIAFERRGARACGTRPQTRKLGKQYARAFKMTDDLTGVRTHRDDLHGDLSKPQSMCCLVDIASLTWVNDQLGRDQGNRVLAAVARSIEHTLAPHRASLFRVGGDEFLAVIQGSDRGQLRAIALRLVADVHALALPYKQSDYRLVGRPQRTCVEVNAAVVTASDAAAGISETWGITDEFRNRVALATYREKQHLGIDAGVVVDLIGA
jgi:diguanylate cyclase (GGDEF)-like protein